MDMGFEENRNVDMEYTCCICGSVCRGWGNNPWPVVKDADAKCCDECNGTIVIAARLEQMFGKEKKND